MGLLGLFWNTGNTLTTSQGPLGDRGLESLSPYPRCCQGFLAVGNDSPGAAAHFGISLTQQIFELLLYAGHSARHWGTAVNQTDLTPLSDGATSST